jgi:hypothetical protein
LVERDHVCPAQTEVRPQRRAIEVFLALYDHPVNPAPRPRWINDKLQPATVAMPPSAKVLYQLYRQLSDQSNAPYHNSYHSKYRYRFNRKNPLQSGSPALANKIRVQCHWGRLIGTAM